MPELASLFSAALGRLKRATGEDYNVVRLLFGRMIACPLDNVVFVRVATAGRPGKASTIALVTGASPKSLLPDQIDDEFHECCALIGAVTADNIASFRAFLENPARRISR